MRKSSLFGELALRLAPHPENVATEALLYLLRTHAGTWPAMRAFLAANGVDAPAHAAFQSQTASTSDGSIPDLVVLDANGIQSVVFEAKFWAGLTPNQPTAYLKRLPSGAPGAVLVIAPAQRLLTLWPKLTEKCAEDGIALDQATEPSTGFRRAVISGSQHLLALTSWRAILAVLSLDAEARGDTNLLGDIQQLSGLCERMDTSTFMPLRAEELSSHVGLRIDQYTSLIDAAVQYLVQNHGPSIKSMSTGGGGSVRGRFFIIGDYGCFLAMSPPLWADYGETPLWLFVQAIEAGEWRSREWINERLVRAYANSSTTVFQDNWSRSTIAIGLPVGAEQDDVLRAIVRQVLAIISHLGQPPVADTTAQIPPSSGPPAPTPA